MNDPTRPRADQLLAHGQSLRAIVRSLIGNDSQVEDIVQESYLATLRGLPPGANLGAWMRGVARKLSFKWVRGETRLRQRQAAAASRAVITGEQSHLLKEIADEVDRLREPFRTVIVMRFWQGLPPRAISKQLGIPVNTVRSRLQTGLGDLRRVLDRSHGSRGAWAAPLLAVGGQASASAGISGTGLAVMGSLVVGGVVAAILGSDLGLQAERPAVTVQVATRSDHPLARPANDKAESRESLEDESVELPPITGQCVAYGSKVPLRACRVRIVTESAGKKQRSPWHDCDDHGRFHVDLRAEDRPTWLEVVGEGRASLQIALNQRGRPLGAIQMPRGIRIHGRVCDRAGVPIEGIRLKVRRLRQSLLPGDASYVPPENWSVHGGYLSCGQTSGGEDLYPLEVGYGKTDHQGEFRLGGLWLGRAQDDDEDMKVENLEECKLVSLRSLDHGGDLRLEIVMRRPYELPRIAGTLLTKAGAPVAGAKIVAISRDWSKAVGVTDPRGRFEIVKSAGVEEADHLTLRMAAVVRGGFATVDPGRNFDWGNTQIRLRALAPVPLTLTTRDSGLQLHRCKLSGVVFSGDDEQLAGHHLAVPDAGGSAGRSCFRVGRLLTHLFLVTPDAQQIYLGLHRVAADTPALEVTRHSLEFLVRDADGRPNWMAQVDLEGDFAGVESEMFLAEPVGYAWAGWLPIRPQSQSGRFKVTIGFDPRRARIRFKSGERIVTVAGDAKGEPVMIAFSRR